MAANPTVVPVALTAPVVQVLSASGDFSNLREIKKQLLLIAGLTRERGLLHSSKWRMPRIWMLTHWPKLTLMLKSMIGQHISCMDAIARKPISCTCILDIWPSGKRTSKK
ncbi:cell division cycle 23 [Rhinolophus ferrumequinum]|uniref:Cell division cycle 23 n=1 Tax=Rhinolophus ferrumequinum TaxID=59479 RepID=A0A7J7RWI6_RHIFE|nr:cell division cycle 23 [Rhinolophus ferrumequinum]